MFVVYYAKLFAYYHTERVDDGKTEGGGVKEEEDVNRNTH